MHSNKKALAVDAPPLGAGARDVSEAEFLGEVQFRVHDALAAASVNQTTDLFQLQSSLTTTSKMKEFVVVPKNLRRTSEYLSQAEHTAVVATRAQHLQQGAQPYIDTGKESNFVEIAEMEILSKKCPLMLSRLHSNGFMVELWEVNEMKLPFQ